MADELQLSIEKLIYGGEGLAHTEGNTVFVPFVLPGEQVRASVRSRKKKLIHANLVEVQQVSPARVAPACPHFGVCGGCDYQHIEITEQVRLKKEILRETLSRLGGVQWTGEIREHTAQPYGYRNRAQWAFRDSLPRAFGYFLPESAHILPIDGCPVLSPRLAETFGQLQELARSNSLPPSILEIEAFADSADEKVALNVAFERFPEPPKALAQKFKSSLPALESLLMLDQSKNRFELDGPGYLLQKAGGFTFHVNHLSFFQVNRFLVEELLQTIVGNAKGCFALDLYAGVGFFTLPLAKSFSKVVSVDANLSATRDLRQNAESAGVMVTSENEHAEEFLKKPQETPDFVVLDPPRAGLGAETAARLANLGAQDICYLSCDPATLARDLAVLTGSERRPEAAVSPEYKYEISEVHLFDLFPQTFHIETLVRLRRVS
ncbi:MAG TPA: 23S rRNA (uracil(1939)-C(5))-methyltransferase RlmD [Verrucomicrobiae bacterium]|nr:23S rRNA (uracil(1939)-C(5))-methyltransferase RlmD [Verrucomicrobiae bacterium]